MVARQVSDGSGDSARMTAFGFDDARGPAAQLARYLRAGESLLWSGRPDPGVRFTPSDAFMVPFSIAWGGFAVIWEASAIASGAAPLFTLFGLPFVAVGFYITFGRFIYKRRQKLRTAYGVTTERVLVAVGDTTLVDSPVKNVPTSMRMSRDGSHVTVTFGNTVGNRATMYANSGMEMLNRGTPAAAFFDVANPSALLSALDRARGQWGQS